MIIITYIDDSGTMRAEVLQSVAYHPDGVNSINGKIVAMEFAQRAYRVLESLGNYDCREDRDTRVLNAITGHIGAA